SLRLRSLPATHPPHHFTLSLHDALPISRSPQHPHPPRRTVSTPARAGDDVYVRADGLELRPHRQLSDVPVRRLAAPPSRVFGLRDLPHHEPHRRGRPHDQGGRRGGTAARRVHCAVHPGGL